MALGLSFGVATCGVAACGAANDEAPHAHRAQKVSRSQTPSRAQKGPEHPTSKQDRASTGRIQKDDRAVPLSDSAPPHDEEADQVLRLSGSESTSLGGPNAGSIEGAVALPRRGRGFRHNPRRPQDARYASVEVVQALIRAARVVHETMDGGELTVNDLGYERGGPIPSHGSHQNGRDVDVLFYLNGADGRPMPSVGAPLDPEGQGVDFKDLSDPSDDVAVQIDVPRTFRFVRALLEDPVAVVQRIFVAEHIRTMLLREAARVSAPSAIVERFGDLTCQPSYPHDDHFHFRFFCTAEDIRKGCLDAMPIYPWHRAELRRLGVRPKWAGTRRLKAPITTKQQARRRAGPLHKSVRRWLARREAWMKQPHPGRRYCR